MPNEKNSTKTLTIVGFVGVFLAILVFSFGVPEGGCGGDEATLSQGAIGTAQDSAFSGDGPYCSNDSGNCTKSNCDGRVGYADNCSIKGSQGARNLP